jgi:hypothetical protein
MIDTSRNPLLISESIFPAPQALALLGKAPDARAIRCPHFTTCGTLEISVSCLFLVYQVPYERPWTANASIAQPAQKLASANAFHFGLVCIKYAIVQYTVMMRK